MAAPCLQMHNSEAGSVKQRNWQHSAVPHRHQEIMRNNLRVPDCAMQSEESPTKWEGKPTARGQIPTGCCWEQWAEGFQEDVAVQWEP